MLQLKCAQTKKFEIRKNIHAAKSLIWQADCYPNKAIHCWGREYAMYTSFLTDEIQLDTILYMIYNSQNEQ